MNISKDVCKKKSLAKKICQTRGSYYFFVVFCSYGRAGLHRSDNGGSGAFPGGLREAQGGWRRRPREAGGGGERLRGQATSTEVSIDQFL